MEIKILKVGYLQTNCYILTKGTSAIIIDPGDEYEKISKELKKLNLKAILLTHHHFDHVGALKNFENIKIFDNRNLEEKEYKIDNFKFEVIYTPGHTSDSISFYFKEENKMFTGDFVFKNTIGRTDLDTGNINEMYTSIEKLKTYPRNTKLYPGHGNTTSIEDEIKNNPFFQ